LGIPEAICFGIARLEVHVDAWNESAKDDCSVVAGEINHPLHRAPSSTDTQINDLLIFKLVREVEKMNHPR
jgi:hypothetical protein